MLTQEKKSKLKRIKDLTQAILLWLMLISGFILATQQVRASWSPTWKGAVKTQEHSNSN